VFGVAKPRAYLVLTPVYDNYHLLAWKTGRSQ